MTALALGALLIAVPAEAQQPQPQGQEDLPEIPEEKLETFAEAYLEIDQVRAEMQMEMQTAEDQTEASQIQQEANAQMEAILDDHGFDVQEYQQITQVLNVDPEQREKFQAILEEEQGADPPSGTPEDVL